jgi:hypothetical protein
MNKILVLVMLLAVFVPAGMSYASTDLECVSFDVIEGWDGRPTRAKVVLTARVASSDQLNDAKLSGAYRSDKQDLTADRNYKPRNPKYQSMNRFRALEDAWCNFAPILPRSLATLPLNKKFTGYIQTVCEGGRTPTFGVLCS